METDDSGKRSPAARQNQATKVTANNAFASSSVAAFAAIAKASASSRDAVTGDAALAV